MKLVTCFERRFIMDINAKIEVFLEKWNEMMNAANDIEEFKWKFSVSITSDNSLLPERTRAINGINESFAAHDMTWNSSNN